MVCNLADLNQTKPNQLTRQFSKMKERGFYGYGNDGGSSNTTAVATAAADAVHR